MWGAGPLPCVPLVCTHRHLTLNQLSPAPLSFSLSPVSLQIVGKAADLMDAISEGATSFLITEYKYMGVFMVRRKKEAAEKRGGE